MGTACQKCKEVIDEDAERCKHCGYEPQRWRKTIHWQGNFGNCVNCDERISVRYAECPRCEYQPSTVRRLLAWGSIIAGVCISFTIIGVIIGLPVMAFGLVLRSPAEPESIGRQSTDLTAGNT